MFRGVFCAKSHVGPDELETVWKTDFSVLTPRDTCPLPLNSILPPAVLALPCQRLSSESVRGPLLLLATYSQCHFCDTQDLQLSCAELFLSVSRLPCVSANKSTLFGPEMLFQKPRGTGALDGAFLGPLRPQTPPLPGHSLGSTSEKQPRPPPWIL